MPFLDRNPHLAEATARITAARLAAEAVPRLHLPKWRLRFVLAVSMFPLLWIVPRCRECGRPWPCHPIVKHLRDRHGWGGSIAPQLRRLSTKRRRAKAARRSPTAVSHRAKPRRRARHIDYGR